MGEEVEKIDERDALEQVRRQARKVQIKSAIAGLVMTLLTLPLP